MTTGPDSWGLVLAAQGGDRDAFGELWRIYQPMVLRFVRSKVRDRDLAEDLTADTFLKAWRAIRTVRDQGRDVAAWLITIARNRVLDHFKSSAHNQELLPRTPIGSQDTGIAQVSGPDVLVPEQLDREAAARIAGYVARLPERQRQVIGLRYGQEATSREIATVMGCSEPATRSLRTNATRSLRHFLAEDGHTSTADFIAAPAPRATPGRKAA